MGYLIHFAPLLPLFPAIRIILLAFSGSLLIVAITGLILQGREIDASIDPLVQGRKFRDRRTAPRLPSNAEFQFLSNGSPASIASAAVMNLSRDGVCLLGTPGLKAGERLLGRLVRRSDPPMIVNAHVVWLRPSRNRILYGLHIDRMQPDEQPAGASASR